MLSLPDDWDYSLNGLVAITKDGPTIVEGNITSGAIENYQLIHYIYNKEGIKKELEEMMNFATSSKGKRI